MALRRLVSTDAALAWLAECGAQALAAGACAVLVEADGAEAFGFGTTTGRGDASVDRDAAGADALAADVQAVEVLIHDPAPETTVDAAPGQHNHEMNNESN